MTTPRPFTIQVPDETLADLPDTLINPLPSAEIEGGSETCLDGDEKTRRHGTNSFRELRSIECRHLVAKSDARATETTGARRYRD